VHSLTELLALVTSHLASDRLSALTSQFAAFAATHHERRRQHRLLHAVALHLHHINAINYHLE
jgi:hypothetical protein